MAVRIRAFDRTLVGNHVYSREEVLASIPSTSKFLPNIFHLTPATFEECPSKGHHTLYITLFLKVPEV